MDGSNQIAGPSPSFWNGTGYVMVRLDLTFSRSDTRKGSCSQHGGTTAPSTSDERLPEVA